MILNPPVIWLQCFIDKEIRLFLLPSTFVTSKTFTKEQLETKIWLDKRLQDITVKEKTVNSLLEKYEQQLKLLDQRQHLESERESIQKNKSQQHGEEASQEKENLLEINKLMNVLDTQLTAKVKDIDEIQLNLMNWKGLVDNDKTLEQLQKYVKTLPDASEMIRLLFDMLVKANVKASVHLDSLALADTKIKVCVSF